MTSGNLSEHRHKTADLPSLLAEVANGCVNCGLCVRECSFLQTHGTPKLIAYDCEALPEATMTSAFGCHLCGLCTAVCPQPIDPAKLFLAMRQEAFQQGIGEFGSHAPLRSYENIGTSKLFTWYGLPKNCTTIFFPGCSLSGTRTETVKQTFYHLQKQILELGMVLDCCTKPSHDLGNTDNFNHKFAALKNTLLKHGISRVLTACPNCFEVFSRYAPELSTTSVYTVLNQMDLPEATKPHEYVTVHDPCIARNDADSQTAVRELLWKSGLTVREMPHSKKRTLCCGQGGGVPMLYPDRSQTWTDKRLRETENHRIVNYCASCTQVFAAQAKSNHILDLLFNPQKTFTDGIKASKAPWTYLNRLTLKWSMQRNLPVALSFERHNSGKSEKLQTVICRKILTLFVKPLFTTLSWRQKAKIQGSD